ncbi:inositol hexakisphosphate kinase 2-like [Anneissia japonica]|uniref:inositol hexakisphosphate kinase 2-like n=1 Tax=Anneissia japonica TaxID=1529436 RepID=UPI001425B9E3|nr:inositol hexakisphosphate kinase 2-like [Anneissia japonica]XP_033103202.1 inositol hexakisphosphate kinase 2-like [Anneissia japonica]
MGWDTVKEDAKGQVLSPFLFQVGGHNSVLKYNENTLCKPLSIREHQFYQTLPEDLMCFVPQYKGIAYVSCEEGKDGDVHLKAYTDKAIRRLSSAHLPSSSGEAAESEDEGNSRAYHHPNNRGSLRRNHHRLPKNSSRRSLLKESEFSFVEDASEFHHGQKHQRSNPFSQKLHRKQIAKMRNHADQSHYEKFILLENVVYKFGTPSILDLKMGIQTYMGDESEEKRQSQIRKAESSTSAKLGVRICGMKVYRADSRTYMFRDKYYGRKVTEDGFREAITLFLFNGYHVQADVIPAIIDKLRQLRTALENQDTYRFYSSSLLVMYNARHRKHEPDSTHSLSDEVDIRMIDFAKTTHGQMGASSHVHEGPDQGFIYGLNNLIQTFKDVYKSCWPDVVSMETKSRLDNYPA